MYVLFVVWEKRSKNGCDDDFVGSMYSLCLILLGRYSLHTRAQENQINIYIKKEEEEEEAEGRGGGTSLDHDDHQKKER